MGRLLKASTDELDAKRKDILQLTADATDFEAIGKVFDAMQVLAKEVVAKPNKAISDSEWVPDHIRTKFCKNLARMGSGNDAKYRKSLPNRKQQGAPSPPPPKGAALRAAPLGCCFLFGKDLLCFASFPMPILGRFPEFDADLVWDPIRI